MRDGAEFDALLDMVRGVRALGMEACVTLGMLTQSQAQRLKEAGLTAYNHNLDTGPEFYKKIISTRTYEDRLETLKAVRAAGIEMCCGGIIGMGESVRRSGRDAGRARRLRSASRKRADQCARRRTRHAARGTAIPSIRSNSCG